MQMKTINLPLVTEVGNRFLYHNKSLNKLSIPLAIKVEGYFLFHNQTLTEINMPLVKVVGYAFLNSNNDVGFSFSALRVMAWNPYGPICQLLHQNINSFEQI